MPGRHSGAGGRTRRLRSHSVSQISWRYATAPEVAEVGVIELTGGGNGYIDPQKAIEKLKLHGAGLWGMQAIVAFVMMVTAIVADTRYGLTYWYTNNSAGGKLRDMQYAWAFFNTLCAICGVWVYLLWNEAVAGVHRDRRVFRQKVHIWLSYFTWAFGMWTSAVVLVSFKNYSLSGIYPTDLTCAFIGAVVCCLLSDLWALGKLCSLGTYAARLEEEWRLAPHEPNEVPMPDGPDLERALPRDMDEEDFQLVERGRRERRRSSAAGGRRGSKSGRRPSTDGLHDDRLRHMNSEESQDPEPSITAARRQSFGIAVSEDGVMMPHAFERMWGALATQGEFQTHITEAVSQGRVVRHLSDRGFQVVAAGTASGLMRVLFCAKEATSNGTGAWFLAELLQDEEALTLEATFKSKSPSVVPGFVQSFMLHHIFTMAES